MQIHESSRLRAFPPVLDQFELRVSRLPFAARSLLAFVGPALEAKPVVEDQDGALPHEIGQEVQHRHLDRRGASIITSRFRETVFSLRLVCE